MGGGNCPQGQFPPYTNESLAIRYPPPAKGKGTGKGWKGKW